MLTVGIVGLPNAGKSTLFNALTRSRQAAVAPYPFCTIEPNVGVIEVPDPRLSRLAEIHHSKAAYPTTVEFFDIAGLVRGASRGEGLGNQFLSHIRQVDAVVEVVRCFEHAEVAHVEAGLDPVRDIEIVRTELALADLAAIARRKEKILQKLRSGDKEARIEGAVLEKLEAALDQGTPARSVQLADAEREVARELFLLTAKPVILALNVSEAEVGGKSPGAARAGERARLEGAEAVEVCAELESQLADLGPAEAAEYLAALGLESPGTDELIRAAYRILGLITFFTGNEKEVRARAIRAGTTALHAAGQVHTDFERGFIAAEVVSCATLDRAGSLHHAREHGLLRHEGRDYVVQDGDVIQFRFHV